MADMVVRANMGDTLKVEHANGDYTLIVFMEGTDAVLVVSKEEHRRIRDRRLRRRRTVIEGASEQ